MKTLIQVDDVFINPDAINYVKDGGEDSCRVTFRGGEELRFDLTPADFNEKVRKALGNQV